MTLADAGEIFTYWESNPPVHLIVQTIARLFGWIPPSQRAHSMRADEIAASAPPGLAVHHNGITGMPEPIFDLEALRVRNGARAAEIAHRISRPARRLSHTLGSA